MLKKQTLITYIIAFLIIIVLNFLLPRLMPGDPISAIYGNEALVAMTPQLKAQLIERFALDRSMLQQFGAYLVSLFKADLGYSYYYATPVINVILSHLPWTLLLVGTSMMLSTGIGIVLGIESGWRRNSKRDKSLFTALVAISGFPDFFVGILLLLLFGVTLGVFPLSGALTPYSGLSGLALAGDVLYHLFLPLLALTLCHVTGSYLLTRNTMITVIKQPFILTAKAKGLRDRTVRYRHAGRNSMLPVVTRTGVAVARMITSLLFIETVFSYPGMGYITYQSLVARDYATLQGILLSVAILVLAINFAVDMMYTRLDPRVRYAR